MKYLKRINELNKETWDNAARKAEEQGQPYLARELRKWGNKSSWKEKVQNNIEFQILEKYSFKMWVERGNWAEKGEEYVGKVVDMYINDIDFHDEYYVIFWYSPELDENYIHNGKILEDFILMATNIYPDGRIEEITNEHNKFINRREALRFIKFLEEIYNVQSKRIRNYKTRVNGIYTDPIDEGEFHKFINDNFGSFDEFKKQIKIRSLYDRH
jgi:ribosomal protein S17E